MGGTGLYARNRIFVTATRAINVMCRAYGGHKKASRVAPARPPVAHPSTGLLGARTPQDAGISTVSTTWITPFDWLTLEIVTSD
jgi:hypothetical protein